MTGALFLPALHQIRLYKWWGKLLRVFFIFIFIGHFNQVGAQGFKAGIPINGQILPEGQVVKICIGTTIQYEDSTPRSARVFWRFKNGIPETSTDFEPRVTYNVEGTDTTFLQVIRGTDTAKTYILVKVGKQKPLAGFSFTPNNDCGSTPVVFKDTSKGVSLQFAWTFGDGTVSTVANPSHTFLESIGTGGTVSFRVKLRVTNDQNCSDTTSHVVTVKKIPDASISNARTDVTYAPFNGQETFRRCASLPSFPFQFSNNSTTPSIIKQYRIQWGEGSPNSVFTSWPAGTIITHVFPIGKSILKVTALGENGCIGEKTYIVFLGTTPAGSLGNNGENSICAKNSLAFPLHDYAGNAAGTTYRFDVNDGTVSEVFQHPPPDTISHFFASGSCTFTSVSYTNAFSANLLIENPCGSSTSQIVPLYVSGKPRANLDIYPYYNICVNTEATISNASSFGGQITTTGGTGSVCSNTGKQVWKITPSTGYTLRSGKLGDLHGNLINSTTWEGGTPTVDLVFTLPGVYAVKVYAGNDNCGINSLVKEVCVRLPPQSKFTMSKRISCAPDTVLFSNISSAPSCIGDTYKWDVIYTDPANCGNGKAYGFVTGTSPVTKDIAIRFDAAGRYIVKLTVTAAGTFFTCPAAVFQDTFWLKTKPQVALDAISARCLGNSFTPGAKVLNCYSDSTVSYRWTFAGGTPATSDLQAPGAVQYTSLGTYLVQLEAKNECGVSVAADSARITATPVARAGPDTSICSGTSLQLGSTPQPGITYKWTPAAALSNANIANPSVTAVYTGINSDTTLVFALAASAGSSCAGFDTVRIIVRKSPVITVNAGSLQVCQGTSTLLVASGAPAFSWNPSAGLDKNIGDSVNATPASTTTYTATGRAANGCSATGGVTVTVVPFVTVDAGTDTIVCSTTSTLQLRGTPAGGTWNGDANLSSSGTFNARAAGIGNFVLYYTAGNSGCVKTDSVKVAVITAPVAVAGPDTTVCQSATPITLQATPAGGRWSNSSFLSSDGKFLPATAGIYQLIYTFGAGTCIDADTIELTVVGGITNNNINSNQEICTGTAPQAILGSVPTGGNGEVTYQWQWNTDSTSWLNLAGATALNFMPGNLNKTTWYRRLASTLLCTGANTNISKSVRILVRPNATAVFAPSAFTGCIPFNITPSLINLTTFGTDIKEYRWLRNNAYIGSGETFPGTTITSAGDSARITLQTISAYGCENDSVSHVFYTVESPNPSFLQSDSVGCGPLTIYFTNNTPKRDDYSYLWNFGQGEVSNAAQPDSVRFAISSNYGDTIYTVTLKTISACDTIITQRQVKVRAQPKALFTPNIAEGCSPLNVTFSNTSYGSNAAYQWNFDDGTGDRPTNADTVHHRFEVAERDTFYVKLTGSNDCGTNSLRYAIVVKPNAIRLDFAVNGNQRFGCAPDTIRFINNTKGATKFLWNFGDGSTLNTIKGIDTVEHIYTNDGNYTIMLECHQWLQRHYGHRNHYTGPKATGFV